jgi:Tfp pilus assembly ATPase PilU
MQPDTAKAILDFLGRDETAATVVVAAGAPPSLRGEHGLSVAIDRIMTPKDIYEMMMAFRNYAQISDDLAALAAGSFAFPVPRMGRFRVDYLTQRGSYVLTVTRILSQVPALRTLFDELAPALKILDLIRTARDPVVTVCGASAASNADFICAMLQEVNASAGQNRLIYTVEQRLSYLIRHDNCIVVQCEAETDVPSLEMGIQNVINLCPDLLVVSEVRSDSELAQIRAAVCRGIPTIISSTEMGHHYLGSRLFSAGRAEASPDHTPRWLAATLTALPQGRLGLEVSERLAAE